MSDTPVASPANPIASGTVTLGVAAGVGTIEFGGTRGNSMPGALLRRLADEIIAASARADVGVIVLRSQGDGPFCGGASFDELKALKTPEDGQRFFTGFSRVIMAIRNSPRPVIARVQGKVAGGGVGIVAAADYAIAVPGAALRLSELALGIAPFVIGPAVERKLGPGAFTHMAFDTEWKDAQWGLAHDLYAKVVPDVAAVDAEVDALARRIAASNPEAVARLKQVCWEGTDHFEALMNERALMSGTLALSKFTQDAIASFGKT